MGKFRLGLVAALGPCEGPWTRTKGNELGVDVTELASGEEVWLDRDGHESVQIKSGFTPLTLSRGYYRFRKILVNGCKPLPTTVRVHLNGQTANSARHN